MQAMVRRLAEKMEKDASSFARPVDQG